MKKKLLFIAAIILIAYCPKAQNWSTLANGVGYYGGSAVYGSTVYNGNLYVTGSFLTAGTLNATGIAEWNGTAWDSVGGGLNYSYGACLTTYNGNLIVGGVFSQAGRVPATDVAQWNGTSWSALGLGIGSIWMGSNVSAFAVYNGNLIVGGAFDSAGGAPANCIAQWNGSSWSTLGLGISTYPSGIGISALAVYNGELYAAGNFDSAGGIAVNNIAKWNGSSWSDVGGGFGYNYYSYCHVYALCVYKGELYAAGAFDTAGGLPVNNIAKWNGISWSNVGGGMPSSTGIQALTVYNNELIAGGEFNIAGYNFANNIAQWDGAKWYAMGTGVTGDISFGNIVGTMVPYNSMLVAAGNFYEAGSQVANDIGTWVGGPPSAANICYVTVDTASKLNEVLWDKTGVDTNMVDSFRVYRNTVSGYQYLTSVSVHAFTDFFDAGSHSNIECAAYKICSVDTDGLVSQLSAPAQTILLQSSIAVGNMVNLSWNAYVGDSVMYYVILRDSTGSGHWQRLDSVANNVNAYVDNKPPTLSNKVHYEISTVLNLHCVPYTHAPHRLASLNDGSSRSNITNLDITGIASIANKSFVNIYPNPNNGMFTIQLANSYQLIANSSLEIYNMLGEKVYAASNIHATNHINLSSQSAGVYMFRVLTETGGLVSEGKFIIEK